MTLGLDQFIVGTDANGNPKIKLKIRVHCLYCGDPTDNDVFCSRLHARLFQRRLDTAVAGVDLRARATDLPTLDLKELEKSAILAALDASEYKQSIAAGLLGITPRTLNHKIERHGITHSSWRKNIPGGRDNRK